MKNLILSLGFILFATFAFAQDDEGDRLIGVWEPSHSKAKVKIEKISGKYYGKIVWLREPTFEDGTPKTDRNNPDESMREVPIKGYRILKDLEYVGKEEWTNGTIYDPENGNTYSGTIKMVDENTLDLRGYVGAKAFGRSDTWKRLQMKKK